MAAGVICGPGIVDAPKHRIPGLPRPRISAMLAAQAKLFARSAMRACLVAALYFGSFIAIGLIAKLALARLGRDTDLTDIQSQAGPNRRRHKGFLLGAWRNEE
jgi:hypothetical protein